MAVDGAATRHVENRHGVAVSERIPRRSAVACIAGGLIGGVGAAVTQFAEATVAKEMLSHPYSPRVFIFTTSLWTVAHVLVLVGVIGLARSSLLGSTRLARVGIWMALAGLVLQIPAELSQVFFAESKIDDTGPVVITGVFGISVVLTAIGFVLAGVSALRTRRWTGWGRWTPLLCGVASVVLTAVAPTDAFLIGVSLFFLSFTVLGAALVAAPARAEVAPEQH